MSFHNYSFDDFSIVNLVLTPYKSIMKVEKLLKRLSELPKNLIVTKVHIETINKFGEPQTIEFKKEEDEIKLIRQRAKSPLLKFWRKNK